MNLPNFKGLLTVLLPLFSGSFILIAYNRHNENNNYTTSKVKTKNKLEYAIENMENTQKSTIIKGDEKELAKIIDYAKNIKKNK